LSLSHSLELPGIVVTLRGKAAQTLNLRNA